MRHLLILAYVSVHDFFRKRLLFSVTTMKLLFIPGFNKFRSFSSKARAYAEFHRAKRKVPAYRNFLKLKQFSSPSFSGITPNIHEIPATDKENYVKLYSMDERCINGKIPTTGVIIDESSGSSGTATNWARGKKERKVNAQFIKFGIRNAFGDKPLFIINAFALGPWATGINVTISCVNFSKLKSLGPDKVKIENTIKHFGNEHKYIIMGYPPFLKALVDGSDINWKNYDISFIFGGESMPEGMRDYLLNKGIKKIISSFGASDIELNISAENNFTISLRRLLRSNAELQKRVLKHTGSLPMIFQFNPTDFLFETSPEGELIITVCRPNYIAPKIRYNIHDKGHVLKVKDLYAILRELHIDTNELTSPETDLPLLFHYGRADATVSFFGANISPTDINEVIFSLPEFSAIINSFCITLQEDNEGNKILVIHLELQSNIPDNSVDHASMESNFFAELRKINQDFREASRMANIETQTSIQFHAPAQGPFANNDIRVKAKYIA